MDGWNVILRTVILYFVVLLVMRLMGKREIGKLSVFDFIVSILIADISAIIIEDRKLPILEGLLPIFTLALLQILFSVLLLKSRRLRQWIDGKPTVLIKEGKIQDDAMAKARYNLDDLLLQLRENGYADVKDVEFAILETSGKLSVFPKTENMPVVKKDLSQKKTNLKPFRMPVPVIVEGEVQDEGLKKLGKNRLWLKREIRKKGYQRFEDIYFATVNHQGELFLDPKGNE
mgnify:CR=1 FL=1